MLTAFVKWAVLCFAPAQSIAAAEQQFGLTAAQIHPANGTENLSRFEFHNTQMGVRFRIVLYASNEAIANKAAAAAFARVAALNRVFSDYESDSELMRACRAARLGVPVPISRELYGVLAQSLNLSRKTQGAFDVTVGPVVKLWRRARRRKRLPDEKRLQEALKAVGFRWLELDPESQRVTFHRSGMRLDLGGIAKGMATDEALKVLRDAGIARALVDGSGDIVVGEPPPNQVGWRIGVAPLAADAEPSLYLQMKGAAVATSGDAHQALEIDGVRYSHIVDPRTGIGLTLPSAVTVIARNGTTADSLASAVSVLGPEAGLKLVEGTPGAESIIVVKDGESVRTFRSSGLERWIGPTE